MTQITQLGCAHCGARIHIAEPFKKLNRESVTCVVCKGLNELMVSEESEDVVFYFERTHVGEGLMSDIDTTNYSCVGGSGDQIVILAPPGRCSKARALNLAAWLVALAEETPGQFNAILEAVKNT